MSIVLITGGTGLVGSALSKALISKGYDVIILSRDPEKYTNSEHLRYAKWDIEKQFIDIAAITNADHIIHLAGENVGEKRWTDKRKKAILDSRIKTSALLVKVLSENQNKVQTFVSAAGISWYGSDPIIPNPHPFTEDKPPTEDFLGETSRQWEASVDPIAGLGIRLVKLRTGIVLAPSGGTLDRFKQMLRYGFATILGNGKQIMSWIHIEDLARLYIYAIENKNLLGVYNAVSPFPVRNKTFVLKFAKELKGKFFVTMYVPSFLLQIVFGERVAEILKSTTVSAEKIKKEGFVFIYPDISCLKQLAKD